MMQFMVKAKFCFLLDLCCILYLKHTQVLLALQNAAWALLYFLTWGIFAITCWDMQCLVYSLHNIQYKCSSSQMYQQTNIFLLKLGFPC